MRGKCFALIIQSLSPVITSSLPVNCRNPLDPKAALLWKHLEKTFSAKVGAKTLVQELFRTTILEGEDAMPVLSKLQSAHAQLNSGGENLSDKMLGYAMTIALPESWSTQKQSLWLQEPLKPESVASAVRAEWQRRILESGGIGTALKVQGKRPHQFNTRSNSGPRDNFPRDANAYCNWHHVKGHSTESCVSRKCAEANKTKNKPQAKVAQAEDVPTAQIAKLDVNYDSDASAFISAAVPTIKNSIPGILSSTLVLPTTCSTPDSAQNDNWL
jgi:hypothetical protein